jgi:hypothetical protein
MRDFWTLVKSKLPMEYVEEVRVSSRPDVTYGSWASPRLSVLERIAPETIKCHFSCHANPIVQILLTREAESTTDGPKEVPQSREHRPVLLLRVR